MKEVVKKFVKEYKWKICLQIVLIFINIYLLTYPPKIIGHIIDLLYNVSANKQEIINNIGFLLVMCIVLLIVRTSWKYYETYISRAFEMIIKNKLFERVMKIKLEKLQNIRNGEIMSYFVKDSSEIRNFVYKLLSYGTRILATLIIATYTMATNVNIGLTIAIICPIIITGFVIVQIKKYIEKSFKKAQEYFTQLSEYVQESTDGIRTTKAYSCEGNKLKEFIRKNRNVKSSNNTVEVHSTLLSTCIEICFGLCYGISILYGSKLVVDGVITIGDFVAFNGYIGLFIGPVSWLPSLISRYKRAQISYKRLNDVFNLEREIINTLPKKAEMQLFGDIKIKNLTYNYPGYLDRTLDDINIDIKKGETLGIIGTIGSGKTTMMNLLLRLYQAQRGQIFIDGTDINDIPIDVLRNNICYITQDSFLFSTTIKENISLFRDEYDEKDIENSTKDAMIYDEIKQMKNDIETVIGERGADLSGGQKQRIVISRAFLNKSNIVIFDDTFSALDNKTEQSLLKNIRELTNNKTCIIISNRISDIKQSDKIIVLEAGKIVEEGTHNTLIAKKRTYYDFYKEQASITDEDSILK